MFSIIALTALLATLPFTSAHTIITYPGWRGDNLHANGTVGVDDYSTGLFPYGMQWMYPCGGMGISSNRTYWPVQGGAVAIQPGWFQGHSKAFIYINMGLGTIPPNYSHPVVPPFQILGPSNNPYDGAGICLPQVPTPTNITVSPGDNATIQVVEAAQHGAALYSCVDITFTDDMSLVQTVNDTNCRNDTNTISFATIFTTESLTAKAKTSAAIIIQTPKILGALSTAILAGAAYLAL